MNDPYADVPVEKWASVTLDLVEKHPLRKDQILQAVSAAWNTILTCKVGPLQFGQDIFPSPQLMGVLLDHLVSYHIAQSLPLLFRRQVGKNDKDVVCLTDDLFSVEIKTSSSPSGIYGNRSYAQPPSLQSGTKVKDGYYICINFEQFPAIEGEEDTIASIPQPKIQLIRFGFLQHSDWIPQKSASGQQAYVSKEAKKHKLVKLYP